MMAPGRRVVVLGILAGLLIPGATGRSADARSRWIALCACTFSTTPTASPAARPSRGATNLDACLHSGFVNELRQAPEDGRVCFGWHSVPKVEYMTRPPSGAPEDIARLGLDSVPGREQHGRVQIALDAAVVADLGPAAVERDPPVEADHVAACLGHRLQQGRGAGPEVD